MKKLILLLLIVVYFLPVVSWGQVTLPHHDPIDYSEGQGLQSQSNWTSLNTGDALLIKAGNLSFTGLPASTGNKVTFDGAGIDAAKAFTQQTSGTVYYSFLLKITALGSLNTTGGYFTGLNEGISTNYGCTVWSRLDGTGFDIGLNPRTTAANTVWSSGTLSLNTTYFIVVAYQIVSGTSNDIVKMWIDPTPGASEPSATLTATNSGTDLSNLNRILIRQDGTSATPFIEMDELRISTLWADAALPVELTSFTASANEGSVVLNWATATEVNNYGFNIERASTPLGMTWEKIGFVNGHGNSNSPKNYTFTDNAVPAGKVQYRLKQIDFDGKFEYSDVVEVNVDAPNKMVLYQNTPNPFNPTTEIKFALPKSGNVELSIYNMLGEKIKTLASGMMNAGEHKVSFNANNYSSGVYLYKLTTDNSTSIKKMILIK